MTFLLVGHKVGNILYYRQADTKQQAISVRKNNVHVLCKNGSRDFFGPWKR